MLSIVHSEYLINLFTKIFDKEYGTYDCKWLRVKGKEEFTDEHSDFYRFKENCEGMITCWLPLMDVPKEKGPLAMCPGSHKLEGP